MSDAERALIGRERRKTPAKGVPIRVPEHEDFTPVGTVLEIAEDDRERALLGRVWQHTANMEMRLRTQLAATEAAALREDVDGLRIAITDIRGEHGNNGKLGALRASHDALSSRLWWIVGIALSGLGGAAIKLVVASSTFASLQASAADSAERVRALEAEVSSLRGQILRRGLRDLVPATAPGKE